MTCGNARGLEVDPFSIACRDAVFLGARFGHKGNRGAVVSFFNTYRGSPRSGEIFALYTLIADEAVLARHAADEQVPDSLQREAYKTVPQNPHGIDYSPVSQGRPPASRLLAGLSFNSDIYRGIRSIPSGAEVISVSRMPYSVNRVAYARAPPSMQASRVPILSRRTLFAGSSRARV